METAEIRRRWLSYFESKGHTIVPSAPLLYDDPNLLFVNAGMVPFKPYFLGQETPPYPRATSVQKCVRTQDIEEVGKTSRHGTFFQMNGNFSFGDYFKAGAIEFAWELLTTSQSAGGYGLEPDKMWVTVYEDDDEAADLWVQLTAIPRERIVRRGSADNYWSMGVPGPGGPCSEIYVDRGPDYGPEGGPAIDEDRFMEIWNLVFMQHELSAVRSKSDFDIRGDLPKKNIDTGMGLERIASILQGVDNMYEIDEVYPVIDRAAELAGKRYGMNTPGATGSHPDDVRLRVVADHVRSSLMLIGDGVTPGNEGRGYVLRRMLRRAVRSMRLLGVDEPCLPQLLPVSMERMSRSYPELAGDFERISTIAYEEEDAFARTLAAGTTILDTAVRRAKRSGATTLPGDDAFALHDTYGFPIDLTLEMAAEQGLKVDESRFRSLMAAQRERAKADAKVKKQGHTDTHAYRDLADSLGRPVDFTGYTQVADSGRVAGLLVDGSPASSAAAGDAVEVVLDATPFYAEGGGQLADRGIIRLGGALVEVDDVQKPITGLIVHKGRVVEGELGVGQQAESSIDIARRRSLSRSHTATHVLHQCLREALSHTATQAGSENSMGRLRFDFTWNKPIPADLFASIEEHINEVLLADLEIGAEVMSKKAALESGATAMFGEKYGDEVRVVSIGDDWSRELCGGTHTQRVGQLGLVKLLGESSVGSGVRRVEALVGFDAYQHLTNESLIVSQLSDLLKARPDDLTARVESIVTRMRDAERHIAAARAQQLLAGAAELAQRAREVDGVRLVAHDAGADVTGDDLRKLALDVRSRLGEDGPAVVAVAAVANQRPIVVIATNAQARARSIRAGDLVKVAAAALGGGGGGKPDLAQGGGTDPSAIAAALREVEAGLHQPATAGR